MLSGSSVVAFVATAAPERAREFYEGVLGLWLVEATPIALVFESGGTTLRVGVVPEVQPAPYTFLGWHCVAFDDEVESLLGVG